MDSFYVLETVLGGCAIFCAGAALVSQIRHQQRMKAIQPKQTSETDYDPNHPWVQMITAQFQEAVKKAIEEHHRNGRQIVVYRDGKLVYISPPESQ